MRINCRRLHQLAPDGSMLIKVNHLKSVLLYQFPGFFLADLTYLLEVFSAEFVYYTTDIRMPDEPFIVSNHLHTIVIYL